MVEGIGQIVHVNVNGVKLAKYLNDVNVQLHGIATEALKLYWTERERFWYRCCLVLLDPNGYATLTDQSMKYFGRYELKIVCNKFAKDITIGIHTFKGKFNAKQAFHQYEMLKPKLRSVSYGPALVDDPNDRISMFMEKASLKYFAQYGVNGDVFNILCLDASQTDFNERVNDKRRKWVNEHNLSNLDKISDRIRLKYNAPNPFSEEAIKLLVDALKIFNEKRGRLHSVSIPSTQ